MDGKRRTSRIFVFSHPRTTSNLLFKIMGSHPSLVTKQCPFIYPFMDAFVFDSERSSPRKAPILDEFFPDSDEYASGFRGHTFQKCLDDIQTLIKDTESKNQVVMIKEHTVQLMNSEVHAANIEKEGQTRPKPVVEDHFLDVDPNQNTTPEPPFPIPNPTFLPDRLLKTLTPVFIIRHPARVIPSYLRVSEPFGGTVFDDDAPLFLVFKWQRMMFDFYKAWYSCTEGAKSAGPGGENLPIVIDGDKLVNDSEQQIHKLCRLLGLDPSPIQFSWEARDGFENLAYAAFLSTIGKSTGVIKSEDSKPLVLEDQAKKWATQWDDATVQEMKRRAENAMEDYEYMLKHSI